MFSFRHGRPSRVRSVECQLAANDARRAPRRRGELSQASDAMVDLRAPSFSPASLIVTLMPGKRGILGGKAFFRLVEGKLAGSDRERGGR